MRREAIKQLHDWKKKSNRKPLIIRGARQVGKTWLIKEFTKEAFQHYIYVNFEDNVLMKELFKQDFDIERILTTLRLSSGVPIDPQTLLIFDEIQEAPRGITALKYFQENAPEYPVIAAGSLLGIAMHNKDSFPVGKVEFIDLYPLTFYEFLEAMGYKGYVDMLNQQDWKLISLFQPKLIEQLRLYYFIGGMPEVVLSFVENKDFNQVRQLQQNLLDAYDRDFSKHAPVNEVPRIRMVWRSIQSQLVKENRKFIYGLLKEGARAKEFEIAIEWLIDAGLIYKVNRCKKPLLPLSAYEDYAAFKLFFLDIGLLCAMSNLPPKSLLEGNVLFSSYKGALTEQYVLQQLKVINRLSIYYWSAENSRGEIDFLVQHEEQIIPIEVKAEENLQSKSLRVFVEKHSNLHGLRLSMSDYREQEWMRNYPLYALDSYFNAINK